MSKSASEIIDEMINHDGFSNWLGIQRVNESEGYVLLKMKVTATMLNGLSIAHGGISYSLADSALAFASNSYGRKAVSIETSISHLKQVKEGDTIYAKSIEISKTFRIGVYHVEIRNDREELVAIFKGTAYISSEEW